MVYYLHHVRMAIEKSDNTTYLDHEWQPPPDLVTYTGYGCGGLFVQCIPGAINEEGAGGSSALLRNWPMNHGKDRLRSYVVLLQRTQGALEPRRTCSDHS